MNKRSAYGVFLLILGLGGLVLPVWYFSSISGVNVIKCVPAQCGHSTYCTPEAQAPNCKTKVSTQDCQPGTLDCGQAHCEYSIEQSKCVVVLDKIN